MSKSQSSNSKSRDHKRLFGEKVGAYPDAKILESLREEHIKEGCGDLIHGCLMRLAEIKEAKSRLPRPSREWTVKFGDWKEEDFSDLVQAFIYGVEKTPLSYAENYKVPVKKFAQTHLKSTKKPEYFYIWDRDSGNPWIHSVFFKAFNRPTLSDALSFFFTYLGYVAHDRVAKQHFEALIRRCRSFAKEEKESGRSPSFIVNNKNSYLTDDALNQIIEDLKKIPVMPREKAGAKKNSPVYTTENLKKIYDLVSGVCSEGFTATDLRTKLFPKIIPEFERTTLEHPWEEWHAEKEDEFCDLEMVDTVINEWKASSSKEGLMAIRETLAMSQEDETQEKIKKTKKLEIIAEKHNKDRKTIEKWGRESLGKLMDLVTANDLNESETKRVFENLSTWALSGEDSE